MCLCVWSVTSVICHPMDCSPPGSSVHGILQARILEWVVMPSSRGSSQSRDWNCIFCIAGGFLTHWATWETLICLYFSQIERLNSCPEVSSPISMPYLLYRSHCLVGFSSCFHHHKSHVKSSWILSFKNSFLPLIFQYHFSRVLFCSFTL